MGAPSVGFAATSPWEGEDCGLGGVSVGGPLGRVRCHVPLEEENIVVFTVLPLQGEVAAKPTEGAPNRLTPPNPPCPTPHISLFDE